MSIVDSFLPSLCAWCRAPSPASPACALCTSRLPWTDDPAGRAWAAWRYESVIASKIRALKFHAGLDAGHLLGSLMAERLARRALPLPELLIPVPLHPRRLQQRGYNQALELGRAISRRLDVGLSPGLAQRVAATPAQTRLSAAERRRNVRGAFSVGPGVRGKRVAILDDVITTGATSGELARAVRVAGARSVEIWAAARAELGHPEVERDAGEHRGTEVRAVEERLEALRGIAVADLPLVPHGDQRGRAEADPVR